jgi:hypothetical protein
VMNLPSRSLRTWVGLIFLSVCIGPHVTAGQGVPGAVTMHRQQAGTPNEKGWYDAESTEGHFRVSLPIPFNDFTVRVRDRSGREAVTHIVGSTSEEGFKFSATEFPRESMTREFDLKGYAEKFRADKSKRVSEERLFKFTGHPAIQFHVSGGQRSAFMRAIVFPSGVLILIVEYPTRLEAKVVPLVKPFFSSLKVR